MWLISTLAAVPNTCTCYYNPFCSQCLIVFICLSLSLAQTFYLWRFPNIMNSDVSERSIFSKNIENFRSSHPRGPCPLDPRRGKPLDPQVKPPSIQSWLHAWDHMIVLSVPWGNVWRSLFYGASIIYFIEVDTCDRCFVLIGVPELAWQSLGFGICFYSCL